MSNEETQTQATDYPSGPEWRWVRQGEILAWHDMEHIDGDWHPTTEAGHTCLRNHSYRRRIEQPQPEPQPEPQPNPDDPSGDGWAWVAKGDTVREGDMWRSGAYSWCTAERVGETVQYNAQYRRRIEPRQPSDSEPDIVEDLRRRLAECEVLLAEADRGGEQVNAELQQLRDQVLALTLERDRYRNQLAGAIEHSSAAAARQQVLEALQTWLRPVLEFVAEHPEDASPLAVAVLGYLPGIASRLIEE